MGSNVPSRFDGLGAEPAPFRAGSVTSLPPDDGHRPGGERKQRRRAELPDEQGPRSIGTLDLAERAGAIPHELLSNINVRVSRRYTGGQPPGGALPPPKTHPKTTP